MFDLEAIMNEVNNIIEEYGRAILDMEGISVMSIKHCNILDNKIYVEGDCQCGTPGCSDLVRNGYELKFIESIREEN